MSGVLHSMLSGIAKRALAVVVGAGAGQKGYATATVLGAAIGSITPATYIDKSGATRSVEAVMYASGSGIFAFGLLGNVANNDNAFTAVTVNATRYVRATSTYTLAGGAVYSLWQWSGAGDAFGALSPSMVTLE